MNRNLYLGCFMVLVTSSFLHAQDAELNGSVRDWSGSVIPKADVRIVNKGTGASRTTQTNGAGLYVLQSLLPGALPGGNQRRRVQEIPAHRSGVARGSESDP